MRRSLASFLLVLAVTSPLWAQQPGDDVVVRAYTFKHQRASEAVPLVYPLLSPRGTVEYQPAGKGTLVIHDTQAAVQRIMPVLRKFDHPPLPLRLEVYVVRASRAVVSPPQGSDLPDWLTKRLHELLSYDNYEMQAQAQLSGIEGQRVIYDLGPEYRVSFRFGTLMNRQRVKLANFRISRQVEGRPEVSLIETNLNLWLDQTMSLGLAKSEASREALMVVLTLREGR